MVDIIENQDEEEVVAENLDDLAQPETPVEDEIPEKYQGKSAKELAQMVEESQRYISQQGNEIGELRKTFDTYIKTNLTQAPSEPEEEIDFFTDPDKAVAKAVDNHPTIKEAKEAAENYRRTSSLNELRLAHPDFQDITQDQSFREWANATPTRQRLYAQGNNYDYEAASELITLWKERKALTDQTVQVEEKARAQQVRQAATGTARGTQSPTSRKIYRRADLIKLHVENPDRYEAMQDEILKAYAEGRVK